MVKKEKYVYLTNKLDSLNLISTHERAVYGAWTQYWEGLISKDELRNIVVVGTQYLSQQLTLHVDNLIL